MAPGKILIVIVAMTIPGVARAQGGPPMLTDDAGTPGSRRWEVNVEWILRAGARVDLSRRFTLMAA